MKQFLLLVFVLFSMSAITQTDTLTICSYNVLNFPDGRDDCGTNTVVPNRADTLRKVLSYIQPDIFVACEIQTEAGADSILTRALNVNGVTSYLSAQWHNNSNGGDLNNQMYYNSDKLVFYSQDIIQTSSRDIDHYVLYANDPTLNVYYDTTFIDVYMCHLKAGQGGSNVAIREAQTQLLMDYIATQPTNHHHFVCGDLNVYTSNEAGYQNLISGPFGLDDPINAPGTWNNNGSFASIHTQSTRSSLNFDCGSKGGSDDRFDQILVSSNVMSGVDSVKYLTGSYAAVGNDGNHFNTNLLNGPNANYPDSVVRALYYMSDHLPVALDVVVNYPTSNGLALYPVVQNATCSGSTDGELTIVANQGQPPYTYQWDAAAGSATTATVTGLGVGQYCVQVTDALGLVDNYCAYVGAPQALTYSAFTVADTDNCNGAIYIVAEGGTEPYTYQWNDPQNQTTASATDLCGGTYEVVITDAEGCSVTAQVSIQTVGIAKLDEKIVKISPNPATDYIVLDGVGAIGSIIILDLSGRTVKETISDKNRELLDISDLRSGTYLVYFANQGPYRFIKK